MRSAPRPYLRILILDADAAIVIRNYGLSELFSESSEPPFNEFPFADF